MDWVTGMQRAIDYVEAHLTEDVDYDAAAREGATLKSFSRLSMKISLEGGSMMDYRIEQKPELVLTGFKRRFTGTPAEREDQECDFYLSTRGNQYMLKGMARDLDTFYNVMTNFGDDGYDFYIAAKLREGMTEKLGEILGAEDAVRAYRTASEWVCCKNKRKL